MQQMKAQRKRKKKGTGSFFFEEGQSLSFLTKKLKGTVPEKSGLLYMLSNSVTFFGCYCERSVAIS